jgi:uncharacterized protein
MTSIDIQRLIKGGEFPDNCPYPELVETHISWVVLCDQFVYKIKKPMHYAFLDFSTLKKRKYYCHRELELNSRLTSDLYLEVVPIRFHLDHFLVGGNRGVVKDYAVRMRRLDREKQMDVLLRKNSVSEQDIEKLAILMARFHEKAPVIRELDPTDLRSRFNALGNEADYLTLQHGTQAAELIHEAVLASNQFLSEKERLLGDRLEQGYYRDGHGDLHARNIFLLPQPVVFDCIEFNDEYRYIDVLNEMAFLCMDLDAFGRPDLSEFLIARYHEQLPCIRNRAERQLFDYYKAYRANVRAKVNSLRAKSASNQNQKKQALDESLRYLKLMASYVSSFG